MKFFPRSRLVALLALAALSTTFGSPAFSQGTDGVADSATPVVKPSPVAPSIAHGVVLPSANVRALPPLDLGPIQAEDAQRAAVDKVLRFGVRRDFPVTLADGKWHPIPGAGVFWTFDLRSEGALGLRVQFRDVDLPDGAQLFVHNPADPTRVFAHGNPSGTDRSFWSRSVYGDRVRVEYYLPSKVAYDRAHQPFRIDAIQHFYRDPVAQTVASLGPGCHNDVSCFPAYSNVASAVGGTGFIVGDSLFCTGQLLATESGDFTPYFLTANHCIDTQSTASSTEIYWFFQTPSCGGAVPSLSSVPQSAGCTLLSTNSASDYTLMMVDGALPAGLFWLGWEASPQPVGTETFGVHHPQGTYKRISFGDVISGGGADFVRSDWFDGPTEPGSSGSGLLRDVDQRLIGQLCCGISGCGSLTWDDYGAFSTTYPSIAGLLVDGSDDAFDDNDSCGTAVSLGPGTYTGLVVKSVDEDWYQITVAAGETIEITADFVDGDGDIDLQLFGSCGGGAVASATSGSDDELINYTNPGGATSLFLRVFLASDTRNEYNLALSGGGGGGPGPANDSCVNAIAVGNGVFAFDTTDATTDGPTEPTLCTFFSYTDVGADVWYCYTAPTTGEVTVSLCGSGYDTKLAVYAGCGCPSPDSAIYCNDDFCDLQSEVTFPASSGETFLLRIGGYNAATGAGTLTISSTAPDVCANAPTVTDGVTLFDSTGATTDGPDEPGACSFFGYTQVGSDVWFSYTATCTGETTASLCGSSYDTKMAVYRGTCPTTASAMACNDDFCDLQSEITFATTAGQSYILRVGGYEGATGAGQLEITCTSNNDDCSGAEPIGDGLTVGTLVGSTHDGEAGCGITSSSPDVWFSYTASCTGMLHIDTCGTSDIGGTDTGVDTVLSVHTGCPGIVGNEVDCNDDWPAGSAPDGCDGVDVGLARDSAVSFPVTAGESFLIRVSVYGAGLPGPFNLNVECAPLASAGDDCTAPIAIGAGSHSGTLVGATNDGAPSCGSSTGSPDVWFSYTATCDGTLRVNTCGTHDLGGVDTGVDTVLSVHSGCPGSTLNELDCNDDADTGTDPSACTGLDTGTLRDSAIALNVVVGQTVLIRVSHFASSFAGPFLLDVSIGCDCSPVTGLSCVEVGGNVNLNWTNGDAYDLVRVYRDGAPIATLGGASTSYTDSSPGASTFTYTVRGDCAGVLTDPVDCNVSIGCNPIVGLVCSSVGTSVQLNWTNGDSYSVVRVTRGGIEIAALAGTATSFADPSLTSGTYVYTVHGECGATSSSADSCVHSHTCFGVSNLSCSVLGGDVALSWTLGDSYTTLTVFRDGGFLTVLGGGSTSYVDVGASAGTHQYEVQGDCGGLLAPAPSCEATIGCSAVATLNCSSVGADVDLDWVNNESYSSIEVHRTGVLVAVLPGASTSYTDSGVPAGNYVYTVTGVCGGVNAAGTPCSLTHAPSSPGDFRRGDCNDDGSTDVADPVALLAFLFDAAVTTVDCEDACDTNDDGSIDVADAVNALAALFTGGSIPPPTTDCGADPNADGLDCASYTSCP